jgi:diguanylate cyclase (GGDEF)-like protein
MTVRQEATTESIDKGQRTWLLYLSWGILATGVYFLLPSAAAQDVFVAFVDASVVTAIAAGILMHRPSYPLPWYLFAVGVGLVFVGDIVWAAYLLRVGAPYPSVADVFYFAGIAFFVVGLLLIGRGGIGKNGANLIDPLVVATGTAMLSWVLLVEQRSDPGSSLPLERLLSVAYLLLYAVMLAIMIRPLFVPAKRVPALYLICGALAALVIFDAAYGSLTSGSYEGYRAGGIVYAGLLFSSALLGTGALHPSMAPLTETAPEASAELTWWRLMLLTGALLLAPAVVAMQVALDQPVDVVLVAGSSALLFVLVVLRMAGMIAERKTLELRLEFQASHDPLTRLPNRSLFTERFEQALARSVRQGSKVALLFVDLDDFKEVNDSSGHQAGDRVLVAVAKRLRTCIRPSDTAARLGGDEFAVLLEDLEDAGGAVQVAERILEELRTPITLGELEAVVGASIGIAVGSGEADDRLGDLLRKADLALYRVKGRGKASYAVFDPGSEDKVDR